MADQCIVCLGDLRTLLALDTTSEVSEARQDGDEGVQNAAKSSLRDTKLSTKSVDDDDEIIAHLLPCKHDLHNACLKPWVERANSCPICRAKFNMVELSEAIGGEVIDTYAVQDKVQEAELDPSMIIEDELVAAEAWEPCTVCGALEEDGSGQMYCDGCDKAVHIFCAGYDDAPEVWYCETCHVDIQNDNVMPRMAIRRSRQQRQARANRRAAGQTLGSTRPRARGTDTTWDRIWQEVSQRIDLDLDFPFDDDEPIRDTRTPAQRREFRQWQRRFELADRQGNANRLRGLAGTMQPSQAVSAPAPESQEELRAWNAFDKARELQEMPPTSRRKRKSTASPASPKEPEPESRALKKPRLRRPPPSATSPPAESSHAAAARGEGEPTFMSSLLYELGAHSNAAASPATSDYVAGQYSPRNSSPARSPARSPGSSGYQSPRALSATPPPPGAMSPPMSSIPCSSPARQVFSPFSPAVESHAASNLSRTHHRGRRRDPNDSGYEENNHAFELNRLAAASPTRALSYSSKEEIQRMVKMALRPRYQEKLLTKDQYTDINRDVSRKMYELVNDASALSAQGERERWQGVAEQEVLKAMALLGLTAAPVPSGAIV